MPNEKKYTVTITVAAPGTVLLDSSGNPQRDEEGDIKTSAAGHMWYSVSDGQNRDAYGFAPIVSGVTGLGSITKGDDETYQSPYYSRTMEITEKQYEQLRQYGESAVRGDSNFSLDYNGINNSCIDFTWDALNSAGLHTRSSILRRPLEEFQGDVKPLNNIDDIQRINAPFPNSELNQESHNEMPTRTWWQRPLTQNTEVNQLQDKLYAGLSEEIDHAGAANFKESMIAATTLACVEKGLTVENIDRMGINTETNTIFASDQWGTKTASVDAFAAANANPQETLQAAQQLHETNLQQQQSNQQVQEQTRGMSMA